MISWPNSFIFLDRWVNNFQFVLDKFSTFLVYAVICQVLELVSDVATSRTLIWVSGKSGNTIIKEVDSHWVNAIKQDIQTQIKLKIINEKGIINIPLGYYLCFWALNAIERVNEVYSFTLTWVARFQYKNLTFLHILFLEFLFEFSHFLW